jgi:hypothetical protein
MKVKRIGFVSAQPKPEHEPETPRQTEAQEPTWTRAEMALLRRAGRSRWNVPEEVRCAAVYQLARMMSDGTADDRARVGAAKTLALLDRIDQTDERQDLQKMKVEFTFRRPDEVRAVSPEIARATIHAALAKVAELEGTPLEEFEEGPPCRSQ